MSLQFQFEEGDFDHAVDNSGDSVGLVANRVTVTRRRRSNPLTARSRGGDFNHQPRDWSPSRLEPARSVLSGAIKAADNTVY